MSSTNGVWSKPVTCKQPGAGVENHNILVPDAKYFAHFSGVQVRNTVS